MASVFSKILYCKYTKTPELEISKTISKAENMHANKHNYQKTAKKEPIWYAIVILACKLAQLLSVLSYDFAARLRKTAIKS